MTTYETAEKLLRHNRSKLVTGARVRPQWLDGGARFGYTSGDSYFLVDPAAGTRVVGEPSGGLEFGSVPSPDGKYAIFRRGHDLWVRTLADGFERALTADGEADFAYGLTPWAPRVLLAKVGIPDLPPAVSWSPDSTRIVTHRTDQREVRQTHLIEVAPADGGAPRLLSQRFAIPGDERRPVGSLVVLDVATGDAVHAQVPAVDMPLLSPIQTRWIWWAEDCVYYLTQARDARTLRLHRLDPASGEVRVVVTETGTTRVEPTQQLGPKPMVEVLPGGREVLWYSQRDGWGHLYLYDVETGAVRRQVTSGEWAVQEILRVTSDSVYFVASGLVTADPYRRSVCRVGLDGSGFTRVLEDELDHVVSVSPSGAYFIDSASATDTPPTITVRDWDGQLLVSLGTADISALEATGWAPPERFCVKAADGVTDIWGVLYKPHSFDPAQSYPVIDNPYPGPHVNRVSPAFDPGMLGHDAEAVAALGFVVVAVDGRGTPGRDKAFHDVSYGRYEIAGSMDDHVTALRQLAMSRPWMDLDRVGIFGLSGGAFATVRAMADFPEFYKVGVAEAGNHDNRHYGMWWGETYDNPVRSTNLDVAERIEGKLLLVHGGLDDNVSPDQTLRLVDRLIEADKDFDLLIVPRAEHAFLGFEHYVSRRRWDYLVRHLQGVEPPSFRLTPTPIDLDLLTDFFG